MVIHLNASHGPCPRLADYAGTTNPSNQPSSSASPHTGHDWLTIIPGMTSRMIWPSPGSTTGR